MTPVDVLVPWRGDCPHRKRAWLWVWNRWAERHPSWRVLVGEDPAGPWCKAYAVEQALRQSTADVLVLADADVWSNGAGLAVEAVAAGRPWAVPHALVYRLDEDATSRVLASEEPAAGMPLAQKPYGGMVGGGIVVLSRDAYRHVPLDPRFLGWGGEDESHGLALAAIFGSPWRGVSPLWHLWHPPQQRLNRHVGSRESNALKTRYQYAARSPESMRKLLAEIGGDRGTTSVGAQH